MEKNQLAQDCTIAKDFWDAIMASSDAAPSVVDNATRAIITYAIPLLEKATVKDITGKEHAAVKYAMYLYAKADELVNNQNDPVLTNQLASCAMMVALEECCYADSTWSYGSRLLFDMKKAGLKLSRTQISAFLAQEGDWSNRSKSDLLNGSVTAVGIYCAKLQTLCQTLPGRATTYGGTEEDLQKIEANGDLDTFPAIFGYYLSEFTIPYLESVGSPDAQKEVAAFCRYLGEQSDFYSAPCSTKYHLCRKGGLAEHTLHVLMQMLWLTLPATRQQLGACVLAAIGHDLCKVGVYKEQFKSKKVYLDANAQAPEAAFVKEDQGGRFYWAQEVGYTFEDKMPFGHGRKSAYILSSFFPEIDADVYSAVDGHMADTATNRNVMKLFMENPMALNLHIADVLATYLDEHE